MRYKTATLSLMLICILFSILSISSVVAAQDDDEESAGVSLVVNDDKISNIKIGNWTAINLTMYDTYGLDWDKLQELPWPMNQIWWQKTVWRIQFGIPDIEKYLGFTSVLFEPEIISDHPEGWSVKMVPPSIGETTVGRNHQVTLFAQVNRLASDYNPTIGIKCTRYDVLGDLAAISYCYIPVKAAPRCYATIEIPETTKEASPKSIVYFSIKVTNRGEYIDTFQFDIKGEKGTYGLVSQQSLVLDSGETQNVELGILTPETFYDIGTPRKVHISIYSIKNPGETYDASVVVITRGFYISPLIIIAIIITSIIILAVIILLYYLNKRGKLRFLDIIFKRKKEKQKESKKKPEKKTKPKKKLFKRSKEEKPVEPDIDKEVEVEKQRREQPVQKIKKQQEKQKPKK
jgi:hypothetical protein